MEPQLERELEAQTIALNRHLYAEGVGLEVDPAGYAAPAEALAGLYARLLEAPAPAERYFAVEARAEARLLAHDHAVEAALDRHAVCPELVCAEGPLTWRNWKTFEREAAEAGQLREGFERLVAASAAALPELEARWAAQRAEFRAHGLTPVDTFSWREGLAVETLRAFLVAAGQGAAADFHRALDELSAAVFGRPAGPAELRALYLNRMYEPLAGLFAGRGDWAADTQRAFQAIGFGLAAVPVDLESRPRKYPGAFCFPVAVPGDVRVSVRIASPHHLVDMLYHEFGHAVHFSGIDPALPFIDRYWIHAGTHETFSTLFEYLLAEPAFLAGQFNLGETAVARLLAFARFKQLLTAAWQSAAALTALEAWVEDLSWVAVEARLAHWAQTFTGVALPAGFARLHPYVNALSIYPAGYVLAEARVTRWLRRLRALGGERWWLSPAVQADVRARIRKGGQVRFPEE